MGWRLELDMLTTQEWEVRRKLPALEIVDTLLARAMDMAENTTASLDLETQLASLKLATTDETDALPCTPATAMVDSIVYGPDNTANMPMSIVEEGDNIVYGPEAAPTIPMCTNAEENTQEMTDLTAVGVIQRTSRKRRKNLRESPLLRRIVNMPDLSRVYDEKGVYTPSFWNNPAVGCIDNTNYRGKHTKHVTGSEEAISTPGLFSENVPGCEGARVTQNNHFSFSNGNAQTTLNLSMTATLAPKYPILSE